MLAGCSSSSLVSPRHRLRSESAAQFEACNFSSMSAQRLDLPCSFPRKDTASRSQAIRPVGIAVEKKPIEGKKKPKASCSLKQKIRLPPLAVAPPQPAFLDATRDEFWNKGKSLKRFAVADADEDEDLYNRAKRKRGVQTFDDSNLQDDNNNNNHVNDDDDDLCLTQLGNGNFWFQPHFEDRVCFVPGEVISPPWSKSIANEIADLGEKQEQQPGQWAVKEGSAAAASSSSSDTQNWRIKLTGNNPTSEQDTGNVSGFSNPGQGVVAVTGGNNGSHGENEGIELISLLVACVEAISSKNIAGISHFIAKLGELASPRGGSPITRLIAYFSEALALRVSRQWPKIFQISNPQYPEDDDTESSSSGLALRLLNQVSPIPRFIQFTSNEILLKAFEGKERIHIIDFDIKQGLQWPSFFQSLAARPNPPTHVRITGIGESKQELIETGDRLSGFAESLNLAFEFHPVVDRLEDVRLWMLHVKEGENVGVNCVLQLHKLLYDETGGTLMDFLGIIRSTNPTVVVVGEQEAEHNERFLEGRVCSSLKYYSALFDLLAGILPSENSVVRMKIEEMFGREIRSIVACEGQERVERHVTFGTWRWMMEKGEFRSAAVGDREFMQSRMLMKMYSSSSHDDGYNVEKQDDGDALTIRWMDQPLYTVSAWAPAPATGARAGEASSSSFRLS